MNGTQVTPGGGGTRADNSDRATPAIRPVDPAEQAALRDFFAALSVESRYRRFFAPVRPTHGLLDLLSGRPANVDAIVAVADGVIVGHAMAADLPERICPDASRVTDVGVVVADAWQRRWVGAALMRALIALAAALRAAGVTEVDDSARRRAEYSGDASNYRVVPSVVVFPRHVDEAAAALDVARRAGVPVTSRGAGTSIAGNAVGSGVVLDFSKHLNRVLAVDPEARTAVVEPGAILDDITAAVAGHGLRFGPDPSTHSRASIGGSIGNNACGSRALRYGRTADNVVSLDLLTAAGERLTARRTGHDGLTAAGPIGAALGSLVAAHLGMIRTEFGRFTRQVSGYSLEHLLPENGADLAKFLAGTEGTLGMITGATVALVPSPKAVALAVLGYPGMPEAADAVPGLLPHQPVAKEGMDARLVEVFRARRGAAAVPALPRGESWLFVETAGG